MQPTILTPKQLASYFKISLPTVYHLTKKGKIPHLKIGQSIRYNLEEVMNFITFNQIGIENKA